VPPQPPPDDHGDDREADPSDAREDPVDRLDVVPDEEADQGDRGRPDHDRRDRVGEERLRRHTRRTCDERDQAGGAGDEPADDDRLAGVAFDRPFGLVDLPLEATHERDLAKESVAVAPPEQVAGRLAQGAEDRAARDHPRDGELALAGVDAAQREDHVPGHDDAGKRGRLEEHRGGDDHVPRRGEERAYPIDQLGDEGQFHAASMPRRRRSETEVSERPLRGISMRARS
jgi:hypothetical protein